LRNWRHTECGLHKELQTTPSKRTVATTGIANCGMRIAECKLRNWRHTECGLRKELQTTPSKRTVAKGTSEIPSRAIGRRPFIGPTDLCSEWLAAIVSKASISAKTGSNRFTGAARFSLSLSDELERGRVTNLIYEQNYSRGVKEKAGSR
jgi:hypothetical protein